MHRPCPIGRDPKGVTLQVPGRSTMDAAYGAEASTIDRWTQAHGDVVDRVKTSVFA
jgi:hypothetical protein